MRSAPEGLGIKQPADRLGDHISLPPASTKRWGPLRKAEIVSAVHSGYLSLDEACQRYALSVEEFLTWKRNVDQFGVAGLRVYGPQHHGRKRNQSGAEQSPE